MKQFGVMPHTGKGMALRLARDTVARLEAAGAGVVLEPEAARAVERPDLARPVEAWPRLDAAIVLGGDGALLRAARLLAARAVPLLAVNVGRLGFLTELEHVHLDAHLPRLLQGDYDVEERMMLRAVLQRAGDVIDEHVALNDAVVNRGTFARIIRIQVTIESELVLDYSGDGIVVATPTGSTGYSLSAGGPIISPRVSSLVLTPICPHALASRSVIVDPADEVTVRVTASHPDIMMTIDGQVGIDVASGDEIKLTRAAAGVRLIRFGPDRFYRELRERLGQGTAYDDPGKNEP